jgi:gliding motility-associated lipoprotein GldH
MRVSGSITFNIGALLIVVSLLFGCEPNRVFEKYISIDQHEWSHNQEIIIETVIKDTTSDYNIFLNIRHNTSYPFSNLWFTLTTTYPSGKTGTLKKQILLGDNKNLEWKSECMRDICIARIPIIEKLHFSEQGKYLFTIQQIMRTDPLTGIMDVGLRIERE